MNQLAGIDRRAQRRKGKGSATEQLREEILRELVALTEIIKHRDAASIPRYG